MTSADVSSARTYPGVVVAAVTLAVAGVIGFIAAPALGLVIATGGVWLSLRSRRALRDNSEFHGWGLSLAAMIVSSVTVALGVLFFLSPLLLSLVFLMTGGMATSG
ncbi:hypothetical protein [Microcella frigidaquae]|uniref:DUF4190 domain-containing protein n=1 Tax=Microcella frigidaquae TaxID=424758 RepID=A0A840X6G6_9MICO|nr:hypothetical protein [Microcella frigidaquae]MBB5616755.1 hypothetical protein [Microcella frigidaquae]NHN43803.1 hypothetical protein [Microcella frigidaquae]